MAELTRLVVESALGGELTAHLGYDKHERAGEEAAGNARNGTRSKAVLTKAGSIEDIVLSLSARGMTHGDISAHLADVYGSDVSKTTIFTIADKVLEGMAEWQKPPEIRGINSDTNTHVGEENHQDCRDNDHPDEIVKELTACLDGCGEAPGAHCHAPTTNAGPISRTVRDCNAVVRCGRALNVQG